MTVRFAKLHGAGNDFLVLEDAEATPPPSLLARLCDRRLGIGADGVLVVVPTGGAEAQLLYWNADGSEAAFCANGTRCAARWAATRWGWREMVLHTGYAPIPARLDGARVALELPPPTALQPWRVLVVDTLEVRVLYGEVGVPHLVVPVEWEDFWERPLAPLAPGLRNHGDLPPGGANVNLVMITGDELAVRSWERGIEGETLSCGSGDVLAGLVAIAEGWVDRPARVRTASGRTLVVEPLAHPPACPSRLVGPAEWVAEGAVSEELLA